MQTITHQEARSLIQYRSDQALDARRREALNAHLADCVECTDYANEIHETETALRITLRKHWNVPPPFLPNVYIKAQIASRYRLFDFMATRSALVGVALLFFVVVYWQFSAPSNDSYSPMLPAGVSAVPTPSILLTSTQTDYIHCQMIRYKLQQTDTLQSLAMRFSIPEAAILNLNNLQPGNITRPAVLTIPICDVTPTSTGDAPTFTNTPSLGPITYTPG